VTIQRIKLEECSPDVRLADGRKKVRIWSGEHRRYWRPNAAGYTLWGEDAGVYTLNEAWRLTSHCGPEKGINFEMTQ
jgi:hypothetical protein